MRIALIMLFLLLGGQFFIPHTSAYIGHAFAEESEDERDGEEPSWDNEEEDEEGDET